MGTGFSAENTFTDFSIIDYDKLESEIKDIFLLNQVIEHLENKILAEKETTDITFFHLGTFIYSKEYLEKRFNV